LSGTNKTDQNKKSKNYKLNKMGKKAKEHRKKVAKKHQTRRKKDAKSLDGCYARTTNKNERAV
jgi:hypothetical protein